MNCPSQWLLAVAFGMGILVGAPALLALAFLLPRKKQAQQLNSSHVHRYFHRSDDK